VRLTADQIERRLQQILRRGSRNVGGSASMARLMLMITRSCELRCAYCVVGLTEEGFGTPHPGSPDPAWRELGVPRGDMSAETLRRAIDALMTSEKPRLGIQLFGGEPTRRYAEMVGALRHAVAHPQRRGRPLELLLTTNGLGLTPDRLAELRELGVTLQLSLDGDAHGSRFRRGHLLDPDEATARVQHAIGLVQASGIGWFMNATLPPVAADELLDRYHWARRVGIPALQMNYATGMLWSEERVQAWVNGLEAMLLDHAARPHGLHLLNWQNEADPVPLCADVMVDVDGTVFQTGALFHERRYPQLKPAYRRAHLDDQAPFDALRFSLSQLWDVTREALSPADWEVFANNVRLGAAADLAVQAVAHQVGRRRSEGSQAL
jgi:hypothetical protein